MLDSIKQISSHRSAIMGIATICVLLFHYGCPIPVMHEIASIGYCGVDIFFFLSGFGLFFSLSKSHAKKKYSKREIILFYWRRFLRIFPVYFIIILIYHISVGNYNIPSLLLDSLGLSFYLRKTPLSHIIDLSFYDWYIPSIFLLYLFFPLIYKCINKSPKYTLLAVIAISICSIVGFNILGSADNNNFMMTTSRWPVFILGVIAGYLIHNKIYISPSISNYLVLISLFALIIEIFMVATLPGEFLWSTALYWTPFIIITPGLVFIMAKGLDRIKATTVYSLLAFIGSLSLEIYLIHIGIIHLWKDNTSVLYTGIPVIDFIWSFTLFFFLILLLSYTLHYVIDRFFVRKCHGHKLA